MATTLPGDVEQVCDLVASRMVGNRRIIVGIAGPPASGKSTLASGVVSALNESLAGTKPIAALLPMDGYHLDNRILEARGLLSRKGAPETFNAQGFCNAVHELVEQLHEGFYPTFDRQLDLAIANAIEISPDVPVIVVEGNYLLLRSDPWSSLKGAFALTVFVSPGFDVLQERLHQRWIDHGLGSEAAMLRATSNDLPNARLVVEQSRNADLHITQI